uniref:Kinase n=2 Tax=Sus scrofa TaxID=9823 RepID=A0A8D1ZBG2_PIG
PCTGNGSARTRCAWLLCLKHEGAEQGVHAEAVWTWAQGHLLQASWLWVHPNQDRAQAAPERVLERSGGEADQCHETAVQQDVTGTITVHLQKDSRGRLSLVANPLKENRGPLKVTEESTAVAIWQTLQQTCGGGGGLPVAQWEHTQPAHAVKDSPATALLRSELHLKAQVSPLLGDADGSQAEKRGFNPWGLHCHQAHLSRLCAEYPENQRHRFLLLENIVSQYKHPCILDLKMGTRQHGDDASEEKKARHAKKCAQSTSARLGLRICGMQVYQADKKHFLCKDKYYGRKLSVEGFRQALCQFLHDGTRLRTELLEPMQHQLQALLSVIRSQSSYRFYSSSLLITYDGQEAAPSSSDTLAKVDVRMIDFAHTTYKGSWNERATYDGPDLGYIFGLENLIQILRDIQEGA